MTNDEWLKSLEPAELKAWFESEHDEDADRLQRENMQLARERDEWKAKCETREVAYKQADAERKRYSEQIDELITERDEWKAMNERLQVALDAVEGCDERCLKLEAERDGYRDKLGRAVDSAWEIVQIMDEGAA